LKLVLDTNVYCDYAEGLPGVVDVIATMGDIIFLPAIVIGELSFGFIKGTKQAYNEKNLQHIIDSLKIIIINVDENVARKYASIYLSLVKKGNKIPLNDVWISACCMEVGGTLLTRDKHFKLVDQIESLIPDT
jgi:predicted nucleic acid-binding protein